MSGGLRRKARVLMVPPFAPNSESPDPASRRRKEPEPTPAQITKAMEFLRLALQYGPRLVREVEREAKAAGHARRTLTRARRELHVKKLPPDVFRGPWRMALQDDKAVAAYQQRKEAKNQRARQRQGNGRRRKRNGDSRKLRNEQLAPVP